VAAWWYFVRPTDALPLVYATAKVIQAALPLVGWWLLGMPRRAAWSLDGRTVRAGLTSGVTLAAGVFALYYGVFRGTAWVEAARPAIEHRLAAFGATSWVGFLAIGLGLSLVHSLFEEYYWRWFVFDALAERIPLSAAFAVSGLAFAAHHVIVIDRLLSGAPAMAVALALTVAAGGAFWAWQRHRYRSLLAPWIGHACVDLAVFWVGWEVLT
jgi:membrane protease YdiL (CAAX protease family)